MKRFFKRLFGFLICLAVIVTGVGMYIGNRAYEEFYDAPWDQILGIENHSRDVSTIRQWERDRDWEPVRVNAPDGKILRGTYIEKSPRLTQDGDPHPWFVPKMNDVSALHGRLSPPGL